MVTLQNNNRHTSAHAEKIFTICNMRPMSIREAPRPEGTGGLSTGSALMVSLTPESIYYHTTDSYTVKIVAIFTSDRPASSSDGDQHKSDDQRSAHGKYRYHRKHCNTASPFIHVAYSESSVLESIANFNILSPTFKSISAVAKYMKYMQK